ncbi:hypothetical protein M378DRAFT_18244 [Amanita muscaria Koide BX008]|uniref:Uncharacterized protein n=1 Tax=Amanita muscaria (strain Koide BX008) TaxID=946122 RepID=A0A0C2WG96_AMAMK|nr:hypothetical protein M378DRAFT_18244 [Amanita muscaria Koide BX008]
MLKHLDSIIWIAISRARAPPYDPPMACHSFSPDCLNALPPPSVESFPLHRHYFLPNVFPKSTEVHHSMFDVGLENHLEPSPFKLTRLHRWELTDRTTGLYTPSASKIVRFSP